MLKKLKKLKNNYDNNRKKTLDDVKKSQKNKVVKDLLSNFNTSIASNNLFVNEYIFFYYFPRMGEKEIIEFI